MSAVVQLNLKVTFTPRLLLSRVACLYKNAESYPTPTLFKKDGSLQKIRSSDTYAELKFSRAAFISFRPGSIKHHETHFRVICREIACVKFVFVNTLKKDRVIAPLNSTYYCRRFAFFFTIHKRPIGSILDRKLNAFFSSIYYNFFKKHRNVQL